MGNFKDFDLDLKKIKENEDVSRATPSIVVCCISGSSTITASIITCQTGGCPSTACSPSDMTACRNGDPGVGVRC